MLTWVSKDATDAAEFDQFLPLTLLILVISAFLCSVFQHEFLNTQFNVFFARVSELFDLNI